MKDQHKKIKGYRDLSKEEIDLMNHIKAHAENTAELLSEVEQLRAEERKWLAVGCPKLNLQQLEESDRCLRVAKESLQTGQMWFVRAVALPDSF